MVEPDIAPPPLTVQVTPALFLSFATAAARLTLFVASTVVVEGVTVTLGLALEPPQPANTKITTETAHKEINFFKYTRASKAARMVRKKPVLTFGEWMRVAGEKESGSTNLPDDKEEN